MTTIGLTYFESKERPIGKRVSTTWRKLIERLTIPRVAFDKGSVPGLSLATFAGDHRALANVERVWAVGLDLDHGVTWERLREKFATCAAYVHSTWSSTPAEPRARVFLPLSRPVNAAEYRLVYASVVGVVEAGGLVVDRAASDGSRFWFLPSHPPGAAFVSHVGVGAPVHVEGALLQAEARRIAEEAARPAPVAPRPLATGGASAFDRARAYLATCPGAVSGSGGHAATFIVAQRLVRSFSLSPEDAFALLWGDWNGRCSPPWGEAALRRKIEQAATAGRMADGDLLQRERAR
jgi:hypothetical protein